MKNIDKNIRQTVKNNLCISCGICEGICPVKAIKATGKGKMVVDKNCTNCGLCKSYCPGLHSGINIEGNVYVQMSGKVEKSYVGRTKDRKILNNAVSGGEVTQIILTLLQNNIYDYALGIQNVCFNKENDMEVYSYQSYSEDYQKSVYTMPSYAKAVRFIIENPDKKIIIIGSGCVISSVKKYLSKNKKSGGYLFIGLFCDCTLNNNIEKYFQRYAKGTKTTITGLQYRSKEENGWPGDLKLLFNEKYIMIPREERYKIVPYFKNERCIYCIDHMNVNSDISVGDNYTGIHSDKLGSNSIVVRTQKGLSIMQLVENKLSLYDIDYNIILDSQNIKAKEKNYIYSKILKKKENIDINIERCNNNLYFEEKEYKELKATLKRLKKGRKYIPFFFDIYVLIKGDSNLYNRLSAKRKLER